MIALPPRRDSRVVASMLIAALGIGLGLATGEPEPMAMAAAATAVCALGLRRAEPIEVDVVSTVEGRRLIEGDAVRITFDVAHPPDRHVGLAIRDRAAALGEVVVEHDEVTPTGSRVVITCDTPVWGRHDLGTVVLRATAPLAMCEWEQRLSGLGEVTVLPRAERLDTLLAPRASHATAGSHPAKVFIGDGSEFVDIRAYQPGDRMRDINWKATARRRAPHVNRRRPERGGDVVIVLDAVPDGYWRRSDVGSELLQRAGQAAWGLARFHLAAQDRVGLLIHQVDGIAWLPPEGGHRAKYRLLETLLGANDSSRDRTRPAWTRHDIPPSALVLGVSSLSEDRSLRQLATLRSNGRAAGVLAIDAAEILHATDELDEATLRLASMVFQARMAYVRRVGTPIVAWRPGEDLGRAVKRLSDLTRRSTRAGAHG